MRLIDADDLKDWSEIVPLTGDGGIDINDFDEKLKLMPTVEAIPIKWIEQYGRENWYDFGTQHNAITEMLKVWRKKNEQLDSVQ